MAVLESILYALHITSDKPQVFGLYHILALVFWALAIAAIAVFRKKINDKTLAIMLISAWAIIWVGEIYKQFDSLFNTTTGLWGYSWDRFPFQFCSSIHYVLPLIVLIKHEKTKQWFIDFLATYSLFAGLIVMVMPGDVFTSNLLLNVQTMLHHGIMVAVGALLYATGKAKLSIFTVLRATVVFVAFLAVAMILNVTIDQPGFNMFYIDWVEGCHLPVIGSLDEVLPYPVFFMVYTVGFMVCATIMWAVAFGADALRKVIVKEKK